MINTTLDHIQSFLLETATEAGEIIENSFEAKYEIKKKNQLANSLVTEVDFISQQRILQKIKNSYPNDAILSEESGYHPGRTANYRIWIVDPLDGTWNYVHGIRNCGVMIALADEVGIMASVIYNPFKKILVQSTRGGGVLLNGSRFKIVEKNKSITSYIVDRGSWQSLFKQEDIGHYCLRSTVDNALQILLGEAKAYFNRSAKVWDLAPVSLIFKEVGFRLSDSYGKPYIWHKERGLAAAPPQIFPRLQTLAAKA